MPIVAAGIGIAALATSVFGSLFGSGKKKEAAYAAAHITDETADLTRQQTDEQFRRLSLQNRQQIGDVNARVGASGFASGYGGPSSMSRYAKTFAAELNTEAAWMRSMGYRKAQLQNESADVQRQAADAGQFGDIMGGVAGGLSSMGSLFTALKMPSMMAGAPGGSSGFGNEDWMKQSPLGGASGT